MAKADRSPASPYDALLPVVPMGAAIPRVLHQTHASSSLAPELAANVERLRAANPGWEYRFYDDRAVRGFIAAEYGPAVVAAYDRLGAAYGAARADLFRYLLLYRVGGVYLDIKSSADRPLDEIVAPDDRFILAHWNETAREAGWGQFDAIAHVPGGEYQQWHIIAAPGHPFLRAVIVAVLAGIDDYRPWRHGLGQRAVLSVTGPIAYTRAVFPILKRHPHREVGDERELGLRYSFVADFAHHRFFASHYTAQRMPLVERTGFRGTVDRGYAQAMRARNWVAVATWPARRRLRRLVER